MGDEYRDLNRGWQSETQMQRAYAQNLGRVDPQLDLHWFDTTGISMIFTQVANPTWGTWQCVNSPQANNDNPDRIGKKIINFELWLRLQVKNTATCSGGLGTIMVVYDRQNNNVAAAAHTVVDLLGNSPSGGTVDATTMRNVDNMGRFEILARKQIYLNSCTNTAGQLSKMTIADPIGTSYLIDDFVDPGRLETEFTTTGTLTGADISTGAIYLVTYVDGTSVGATAPGICHTLVGSTRLGFLCA